MIDHYEVLEVSPDASSETLKEQWRFLVSVFHPDRFLTAGEAKRAKVEEKTKAINAAYYVLSDPARRSEYDRERTAHQRRRQAASAHPPPPDPSRPKSTAQASPPRPTGERATPHPTTSGAYHSPQEEEMVGYCIEIMRETGRASASLFQRRFRIGYTRAARLIAILEARGVVGPDQGHSEREILVDLAPFGNPPVPEPAASSVIQNLVDEKQLLKADKQRLETQLRMQQALTARQATGRRSSPVRGGCARTCGCLLLGIAGLAFLVVWSRSCTNPAGAPSAASRTSSLPPSPQGAALDRNLASPPVIRRAVAVDGSTPSIDHSGDVLPGLYTVTGIPKNDALNVRSGAGSNYPTIARLPSGCSGVLVMGISSMNGKTEWVQVKIGGQYGWVTRAYLKAQ